jgi:hypothetical protein
MIGYKIAKNVDCDRVLITLEIPSDALTNMERSAISVRETAKYRANKATVLKIEDAAGKEYPMATSSCYDFKQLTYRVGETIKESSYAIDPEEVSAAGIHYFLTKRVAELYGLERVKNGLFQRWHENGLKEEEVIYVDRKRHGLYQSWYKNGNKAEEVLYVDGKRHGLYQWWYSNGQKSEQATYLEGKRHGFYQRWYANGQTMEEGTYVDEKLHGLFQLWYPNGQKASESTYVDGTRQ